MSADHVIKSGRFKGKKIEMASTSGLALVRDVAEDFMREIFEMEPHGNLLDIFVRIRGVQ